MGKNIKIDYQNQQYILEYNRKAITLLEEDGISVNDIEDLSRGKCKKQITLTTKLIHRAFFKNHPDVSEDFALEIFESIPNKQDFIAAIIVLYSEPIISLFENKGETGNVNWGLNK